MTEERLPKSPKECEVSECKFADIKHIFEKYHYKKGQIGGGISFCLKMTFEDRIIGGTVVGKPRHQGKYKNLLEIRRMALLDEAPKYSESFLLGKTVKFIKNNTDAYGALSYADLTVGHYGTIYRAANFTEVGETEPSRSVLWNGKRYHPRSLTIDRPYSYRLREALKRGEAVKVKGKPKKIFTYVFHAKNKRT